MVLNEILPELLFLSRILLQSMKVHWQKCYDGVDSLHSREQAEDELFVLSPGLALISRCAQRHPHQAGQQQPQLWVTEGSQLYNIHLLHCFKCIKAYKLLPCHLCNVICKMLQLDNWRQYRVKQSKVEMQKTLDYSQLYKCVKWIPVSTSDQQVIKLIKNIRSRALWMQSDLWYVRMNKVVEEIHSYWILLEHRKHMTHKKRIIYHLRYDPGMHG